MLLTVFVSDFILGSLKSSLLGTVIPLAALEPEEELLENTEDSYKRRIMIVIVLVIMCSFPYIYLLMSPFSGILRVCVYLGC